MESVCYGSFVYNHGIHGNDTIVSNNSWGNNNTVMNNNSIANTVMNNNTIPNTIMNNNTMPTKVMRNKSMQNIVMDNETYPPISTNHSSSNPYQYEKLEWKTSDLTARLHWVDWGRVGEETFSQQHNVCKQI